MRKPASAPPAASSQGTAPAWPGYLAALLGTIAGMFALYYGALFVLSATGRLPPPAFTNALCIDEKLASMRLGHPAEPSMLVIGSSVAWRHFDGDTVTRASPGTVPYNAGMCGRSISQTEYATAWLLDHFVTVHDVVLITSPQDFDSCPAASAVFFDREDVDDYVFGGASAWPFYTRYFSLVSLVRNALSIADQRSGADRIDPLVFDKYGSGPLGGHGVRGSLLYGKAAEADPACLEALSRLGETLKREGRRLMVVSTPLHPEWKRLHDADGAAMGRLGAAIRAALDGTGAEYWDGNASPSLAPDDFFDAIHLRWTAVPRFTSELVKAFHLDAGVARALAPAPRRGA